MSVPEFTTKPTIYIIHENDAWIESLKGFLDEMNQPYVDWFAHEGKIDLDSVPPEGVFYNRMSASSHTRDHRYAVEFTETLLSWLEAHDRRVINGRKALTLEVRKTEQLLAQKRFGIKSPRSIMANNAHDLVKAAKELNLLPFIVKPNRGGKGLGVKMYNTVAQLEDDVANGQAPESLDGNCLVKQYVKPRDGRITRVEMIGGKYYYAVSVDASGGFELCPADVCNLEGAFCPADSNEQPEGTAAKFKLIENYVNPDLDKYVDLLKWANIEIGAVEYAEDENGDRFVYDININTNYNSGAEKELDNEFQGMRRIAEFLRSELQVLEHIKIGQTARRA